GAGWDHRVSDHGTGHALHLGRFPPGGRDLSDRCVADRSCQLECIAGGGDRGGHRGVPPQGESAAHTHRQGAGVPLGNLMKLAIIGGGSWGTALAMVLAPRSEAVSLWVYETDLAGRMTHSRVDDVF